MSTSTPVVPPAAARALDTPPRASESASLILIAWAVILLISSLPAIVLREFLGIDAPWMAWAIVALTAGLWLASRVLTALHPLERFLAVMTVVGILLAAIPVILESDLWRTLVPPTAQPMLVRLAERALLAACALVVIAAAFVLGADRREAYLVVGDLNAPTTARGRNGTFWRWGTFGPIAVVGLMLLMIWFVFPRLPDRFDLFGALPFIGIGAVAALLNAFWEEVAFRAVPLSMLQRAVTPSMGVVMLAVYFGLGHFYGGIPSEWMGVIATGAIGLLFGRAMIETKGSGWPLALHFAADLVIFTVLAIGSVA